MITANAHQIKSCYEKKDYDSKDAAKKRALQLKKVDVKLFPYKCSHCNKWHLTSKTPEEQRVKSREMKNKL